MFPTPPPRFRTALRRSIDAAIEFATLGEYGWAAAWEGAGRPDDAGASASRAAPSGSLTAMAGDAVGATVTVEQPAAALVRPLSAAGRARRDADSRNAPRCAGQPLRSRAFEPALPRTARTRDGMAPREQRCSADAAA